MKMATLLNSNLARRLVLWVAGVAALIFSIGIFLDYRFSRDYIIHNSELKAAETVRSSVSDLSVVLQGVQRSTELFAGVLSSKNISSDEMGDMLRGAVAGSHGLYGAAIAIDPGISGHASGFAPYYYHSGDAIGFSDLGLAYPRGYEQESWFSRPKRELRSLWSEPYFDAGGGNALMTTYSVPIMRDRDGRPSFFGVVTADISLKVIQAYLDRIRLGDSGFAFLLSEQGSLISYPEERYLLQTLHSVFPLLGNEVGWKNAIFRALDGGSDTVRVPCPHQKGQCLLAYSPFADTGWALMVVYPENDILAELKKYIYKTLVMAFSCIFVLLISVVLIARNITWPLVALADAADKLGDGSLDVELPESKNDDEVAHLVSAFSRMQLRLRAYIARVEMEVASRNRMQGELDAARQIQMEMLPQAGDAYVHMPAYDIHARLIPAKAVGGDLYTWFRPDETHIYLVIGDVSDKGVPAALFMARVVTLLQQHLVQNIAPKDVLALLNEKLVERNDACMFATLSCAHIDLESGVMTWASAGHNAPLLRRDGVVMVLEQENGPALGLMEQQDFPGNDVVLHPGDIVLMCTDGVDEAMNPAHELFGMDRLQKAVLGCQVNTVGGIGRCVLDQVREHADSEPQSDDIALLVFLWTGCDIC